MFAAKNTLQSLLKYIWGSWGIWLSGAVAMAQQPAIDSLQRLLASSQHDTLRVTRLIDLAKIYRSSDPARTRSLLMEAYQLALQTDYIQGQARVLNSMGIVYTITGEQENAIIHYLEALTIANDHGLHKFKGGVLGNLGVLYEDLRDTAKALHYHRLAMQAGQQTGVLAYEASAMNNIGGIFMDNKLYDSAFFYLRKSLAVKSKMKDSLLVLTTLNNIGKSFFRIGNIDSAQHYASLSLRLNQHRKLGEEISARLLQADIWVVQKKESAAEQELLFCLQNSRQLGLNEITFGSYERLVALYEAQNNPTAANQYLHQWLGFQDSITAAELAAKAQNLNQGLSLQSRLSELKIQAHRQNQWLLSLGVVLTLLLGGGMVLIAVGRSRNRAIRRLHTLSQQMKALNQELEDRVQQRTAELEARNRQLEEYTHRNSHEVRARIATLMGLIQVIRLRQLPPDIEKWVDAIAWEAEQLDHNIHQNNATLNPDSP